MQRFYVRAKSVNSVRKAFGRAPGGVRVIGRYDRETIECGHTMDDRSFGKNWPIILSRLAKAGLSVGVKAEDAKFLEPRTGSSFDRLTSGS